MTTAQEAAAAPDLLSSTVASPSAAPLPYKAKSPDASALSVTGTWLSPPTLLVLPVIGILAWAHLAFARLLGFTPTFSDLVAVLPSYKPWSTLGCYYGLSFVVYWIKPTVMDELGQAFGLSRRERWDLRWQADNYHALLSLIGTWAILLGTEGSEHMVAEGVVILSCTLAVMFVVYINLSYSCDFVSDKPAAAATPSTPSIPPIASLFDSSSAAPARKEGAIQLD